jgi:hypothetical protein
MAFCYVHSPLWSITRIIFFLFYFILFIIPFLVSTVQLSNHSHPHFSNSSDQEAQEALIRFMSAITYDPTQSLSATWKPNVSFYEWTSIICSRRR